MYNKSMKESPEKFIAPEEEETKPEKKKKVSAHDSVAHALENIDEVSALEEEILADAEIEEPHTGPEHESHKTSRDPIIDHLSRRIQPEEPEVKTKKDRPEDHPEFV